MKIRTTIRALVCAIALSFGSAWALAASHVKVSGKTGESTFFALNDKPTVTFTANKLVITAGNKTVEYPLNEFRSFEFADPSSTGIGTAPSPNESEAVFSFGNRFTAKAYNLARACRYSMYLDSSLYRPRLTLTAR